jgi:hypothetical protein
MESGLFFTRLFTRSSFIFDRQEIAGYIHEQMINVTTLHSYIMYDRSSSIADSHVHLRVHVSVSAASVCQVHTCGPW